LRAWDQHQATAIQLTPTAHVAIAQFHKVDRPVSFVPPSAHPHLVLPGINGDDRPRPDDRVEGVVLKPDVTIKTGFGVELLQKFNRNLSIGLVALGDWAGATPMSATMRRQTWRGNLRFLYQIFLGP
jgi:hypothetical protein